MERILDTYKTLCLTPSDIYEHLPTLRKYATFSNHITEMGVRNVVSTWAFLAGCPQTLISIDINPCPVDYARYLASENGIDFKFIQGDTTKLEIENTDLLFIDTLHAYGQLKLELELHASKVRKHIIFHDTTTFGIQSECPYPSEFGPSYDKGLWPAIEEFLVSNQDWYLKEKFANNNGLTILERR